MARGKRFLIPGTVVLIAIAAGALLLLRRHTRTESPASAAPPGATEFTASEVSLSGTIRAQSTVSVPVPVEGTIEAFLADAGEFVHEGQVLAEIRNSALEMRKEAARAELERAAAGVNTRESRLIAVRLEASRARAEASRARSEYERAERNFQRQQFLLEKGATPRLVFEKARDEYELTKEIFESIDEAARAAEDGVARLNRELDAIKKELAAKTQEFEQASARAAAGQIVSPVDGLVVFRRGEKGDAVDPAIENLFVIAVDLSLLEVVVEPEPPALERVRAGQEALIQVAELPGHGIPGKVREVKDGKVIVEFSSPTPEVKPGLTAQVLIKLT